jgi:hypothetical protein
MAARDDLMRMLHSPWLWAFWSCAFLSVALVASLFATEWSMMVWVKAVEFVNPGVDAPDNWALAITYCVKTATLIMGVGVVAGAVEAVRNFKLKNDKTTSGRTRPVSHPLP